jgi:hypothetical protein
VAAITTAIATVHETSFGAARISTSVSRSSIPPVGQDDPLGLPSVPPSGLSPSWYWRIGKISRLRAACRRALGNARRQVRQPPPSQVPKRFRPQDDERRRRDDDCLMVKSEFWLALVWVAWVTKRDGRRCRRERPRARALFIDRILSPQREGPNLPNFAYLPPAYLA